MPKDKELADHERAHSGKPGSKVDHSGRGPRSRLTSEEHGALKHAADYAMEEMYRTPETLPHRISTVERVANKSEGHTKHERHVARNVIQHMYESAHVAPEVMDPHKEEHFDSAFKKMGGKV